jgi:hypothetical protein
MKKANRTTKSSDDMRDEYALDYRRARPNRFASRMSGEVVAVVLEPDVAAVFDSSESVNRFLRSVISAIPSTGRQVAARKPRRKAG